MLVTPDGRRVLRGDKDWQYWKFVWRSSLVTITTLVDNLQLVHFKTANVYARASQLALPTEHPFRRLMSIFTSGTILANVQAMHILLGRKQMLHRASPFEDFEEVTDMIQQRLPDITQIPGVVKVFNESHPDYHQDMVAYIADGKQVANAMKDFASNFMRIYEPYYCDAAGFVRDPALVRFMRIVMRESTEAQYKPAMPSEGGENGAGISCSDMAYRLSVMMFIVTAWHRQVGLVSAYYSDPEVASMSWKDGEAFGRPRQHMLASVITAFTSTEQPKLLSDERSAIFDDVFLGYAAADAWIKFMAALRSVEDNINLANLWRIPFNTMLPSLLECSVAK